MTDERMLILEMLEKGKINAAEAKALLDALQDGPTPDQYDEAQRSEAFDTPGNTARDYVEKTRERVEESIKRLRETLRQKGPSSEEIDNVVKHVQRGVSRVIDELPDVMTRLRNLDFTIGPGHTFEETFAGRLSPESDIHIQVDNHDGRIHVEEGEGLAYSVRVHSRVNVANEDEAMALNNAATTWHASDSGFKLSVGNDPNVASKVYITLPRSLNYHADLTTEDGSITWKNVSADRLHLSAEDGSITVDRAQAEKIDVHTSDGSITMKHVQGKYVDMASEEGSIRFAGYAERLRGKAEDGSVRVRLLPEMRPQDAVQGCLEWDFSAKDGSVHIALPTGDDEAYRLSLRANEGTIAVSLPELTLQPDAPPRTSYEGSTLDFDTKPFRAVINARTEDGSIRVTASEPAREDA